MRKKLSMNIFVGRIGNPSESPGTDCQSVLQVLHPAPWIAACLTFLILALSATADQAIYAQDGADAEKLVREIYVPYEDLNVLLESEVRRVYLTRDEYDELLAKAQKTGPDQPPPRGAVILAAEYEARVEDGRARLSGQLDIEILDEGLHALPLELAGVGVRSAMMGNASAAIGLNEKGQPVLFVEGVGRRRLEFEMVAPVQTSAAQQTLDFRLPAPAATRMRVVVPGNVDVKSGAKVVSRLVDEDAGETRFELLLPRGPTSLVMSLNNRMLRRQRVVVARSVLVDEITAAYERLHATISLDVLHGAADAIRFALPEGFEPTEVVGPQISRWVVNDADEGQVLEITLREAATDNVVVNMSATRAPARLTDWEMPQLVPLDVAGQVAVVGIVVEERLKTESLSQKGLIPVDNVVLTAALPASVFRAEPGAPRVRPVAAYYAPGEQYTLGASFRKPPQRLEVTTNVLLMLEETGHLVHGGFALLPEVEKLFAVRFSVSPGWHVTEVTGADGSQLPMERYDDPQGKSLVRVRLPQGVPPGEVASVRFKATRVPAEWLGGWPQQTVAFPRFAVQGAARDIGAIAVRADDDFVVRPDELAGVVPLDENEKEKYGLGGVESSLAYRYDGQPYQATMTVTRQTPTLTARGFSFLKIAPGGLTAHYEVIYDIQQARTRRLSLLLPKNTPASLSIEGLDGVTVKEFSSEDADDGRRWNVLLAEATQGAVRLAVEFQEPLGDRDLDDHELPLVRADGVAYQSAVVAVEGSAELDIEVATDARRVDVGELVAAQYRVGRRLLGAFEFVGAPKKVTVDVHRRPGYGLSPAIVQRAELVTLLSTSGLAQTAARYHLRTKALFLEAKLPTDAILWSAYLDGKPVAPQRDGDSLLLSLPATSQSVMRDLQIVYETPASLVTGIHGDVTAEAPVLLLRDDRDAQQREVPAADVTWQLVLPQGHRVVDSSGTVFTELPERELPVGNVLSALYVLMGGLQSPMQAARESAGRSSIIQGLSGPATSSYYLEDDVQYFEHYAVPRAPAARPMEDEPSTRPSVAVDEFDMDAPAQAERPQLETTAETAQPADEAMEQEGVMAGEAVRRGRRTAQPQAQAAPVGQPGPPQTPASGQQVWEDQQEGKPSKFWALEGVRSLRIDLQQIEEQDTATFQSLGVRPLLRVTLANEGRIESLAWGVASLVFVIGVWLTRRSARAKAKYVIFIALAALVLPIIMAVIAEMVTVVAGWHEWGDTFDLAFYAACLLVPYYLIAGLVRWLARKCCSRCCPGVCAAPGQAATAVVLLAIALMIVSSPAAAQAPKPPAFDPSGLIDLLTPRTPVTLPKDAVIIPYDADDGAEGVENAEKVLVPYDKYVELWNRAFSDQKLETEPPIVPYSLAGAAYDATLTGEDYLLLTGHLDVGVFTEKEVQIPFKLEGGVLASATLDGKPARLQIVQPVGRVSRPVPDGSGEPSYNAANATAQQAVQPAPKAQRRTAQQQEQAAVAPPGCFALLYVSGEGRKRIEMAVRIKLQRRGGWRVATGRAPAAPATALTLTVPTTGTEVRVSGISDRGDYETTADNEQIVTALSADREFKIEWRPKVAEGQVDRSLTVGSEAVLDVQEDGLRLAWRLNLQFPRSRRDTFTVSIPAEYLVEEIVGDNVRGWQVEPDEDRQAMEVTLLDEAADSETVTLHLSRRGVVEADGATPIGAPVVLVQDAALHKGRLTIRRSPLLDLRIDNVPGVPRTDISTETIAGVQAGGPAQESPLGLRPYQAYEFSSTPFTVRLTTTPIAGETSATVQTLVRIAEREATLESQVILNVRNRPVYRMRMYVPETLKLDGVSAPGDFDWAITNEQDRRLLSIYLAAGQKQMFKVQIHGSLGRRQAADPVPAPKLEVLDVTRQTGDMAVQIDPAFNVKAVGLNNCETILRDRVFGWLQADQRPLVPLALRYEAPNYEATFEITPRRAQISGYTVTNVKVTDVAIEETIIVDLTVREAGIREVSFLLPDWMAGARINAPMLRQKSIEDADDGWKRIRLELQDEIIGQYRVLVENDRLLVTTGVDESELPEAPIPVVETGRTEGRYVTLENAGRDELIVVDQSGLEPLNRQQSQWRRLAAILGEGITTAYNVLGNAASPRLSFKTKQRKTVETAGAQIGLAETLLMVDASGAYRGRQTYHVNNTTEQFLQISLPEGSRLWTAIVAGQPVKPTEVPGGQSPNQVRIPLIKTAEGDRDYPVVLKYGGALDPVGTLQQVRFPLIRTVKIKVDLSQVRLRLPQTHRWYNFGGTMRQVYEEGTFQADVLLYKGKQVKRLRQVLSGDNPYAKLRSANNLKQIGLALQDFGESDLMSNDDFSKNYSANSAAVEDAQKQAQEFLVQEGEAAAVGNRGRLNDFWRMQDNGLARNVVTDLNLNFPGGAALKPTKPQADDKTFNKWLAGNQLERKTKQSKKEIESRLQIKMPQKPVGGRLKGLAADQQLLAGIAVPEKQAEGREQMQQSQSQARALLRSQKDLTREYQQQLEEDNRRLGDQRQILRNAQSYFSRRGESAGVAGRSVERSDGLALGIGGAAFSADGRQLAVQPPGAEEAPAAEPHLASLDVDLPERGTEFLFTTALGEIEITAVPVSESLASRLARLVGIGVVAAILWLVCWLICRTWNWLSTSRLVGALLLLVGLVSLLLFPIAGTIAVVVGFVQLIRLSITKRRRRRNRQGEPAAAGS